MAHPDPNAPLGSTAPPIWSMVVGAIFGAITLLGFFAFAFMAGTEYVDFICHSYTLIGITFGLGAALSTSFIGGYAAATGSMGTTAQNNALRFSAGGGIAVLIIIIFALAYLLKPDNCVTKNSWIIHFEKIPGAASIDNPFWNKLTKYQSTGAINGLEDLSVLFEPSPGQQINDGRVMLRNGSDAICWLHIQLVSSEKDITLDHDNYSFRSIDLPPDGNVHLGYFGSPQLASKHKGNSCFRAEFQGEIIGHLFVASNDHKVVYVHSTIDPDSNNPDYYAYLEKLNTFGNSYFGWLLPAYANSVPQTDVTFGQLRSKLDSSEPKERVDARIYLGEHFDVYSTDTVRELFKPNQDPNYLVGLLHGLITGIYKASHGDLLPGHPCDLHTELPYVNAYLKQLVELTGHPDEHVRQQAVRLIQRYPVDGFFDIYDAMPNLGDSQTCNKEAEMNRSKFIRYGSIFFYYNRIIQYMYNHTLLNEYALSSIDNLTKKAFQDAGCLPADYRVDLGSVYFARAIVLQNDINLRHRAKHEARNFLDFIDNNGGRDAYFQDSHIDIAEKILG